MNREIVAMFPNGIKALIVDNDARFIMSSSMLLSLLNYKVTSCGSPTAALKFFSGDKNKDVDVVLINAEKVATCGFDFRGIVETDLGIPRHLLLAAGSRGHRRRGADELLRTLGNATYILRSPLDVKEVCDLWMVIGWRKCYLENKAKGTDDGRRVVPTAAVQAFMAGGGSSSSSTTVVDEETEENEDRIHFKVVGAGRRCRRNRKRKRGCNTSVAGSSGTTVAVPGDQTAKRQGRINVTRDKDGRDDDVSSQQQPATQKAAVPTVSQQQEQQPAAATTIEPITPPRWNQNQPAAGQVIFGNIAPPMGVANMATTVTSELPEFSRGGNQQQQQNVCPPSMFGPFPYQGPRPPVLKPAVFVPLPRYSGADGSIGGATVVGASTAGAGEYGNATTSALGTLNLGTEQDGHDELAAMMAAYTESMSNPPVAPEVATAAMYNSSCTLMALQRQRIGHSVAENRAGAMDTLNNVNSYINYSSAAVVAPQHVGHGVAPKHPAAIEEVPNNNGDNFSTYSTSLMAPNNQVLDMASNVNELAMAGGAFFSNGDDDASFTAPQDVATEPNGDQLAPGAMDLDTISSSLMASPGSGAGMDGNPALELEAMFSPDQYDNTMFPLEALLALDDAPVYETGVDYQQQGGADGGTAGDAAGTSLIGGADDNLDVLDDYLMDMDSAEDFNNGRE